jgi:hypothetical protein
MNWRNTWLLVGIALVLFGFIFFYEQHVPIVDRIAKPQPLLPEFRPSSVSALQLTRGTTFTIALEQTNGSWRYSRPFSYPAADVAVKSFLEMIAEVVPTTYITPAEMVARKQTSAHFGFDSPAISITLRSGNERHDIRIGARTPAGDQFYAEVLGAPGIYVIGSAVFDRLPQTPHQWRETALFRLDDQRVERLDVTRAGAGGFGLQRDQTNGVWRLIRPAHRADQLKVDFLIKSLSEARIATFVSDDPRDDSDIYGFQNPIAEVALGSGTSLQRVLLGGTPTNDTAHIYARQVNTSNVVLVSRSAMEAVSTPYQELRDRRLTGFAPDLVEIVDIQSSDPFSVRRQPNGTWTVEESTVDGDFMRMFVNYFSQIQVRDFVKDVVTDYAPYGLDTPRRQLSFRGSVTNSSGAVTNTVIAHIDFGTNHAEIRENIYVRRSDENSVYTIHALDFLHVPAAAWQLRDHRIWRFSTNDVGRVAVSKGGASRQFLRSPSGQWATTSGAIDAFAVEETIFRLGDLSAVAWLGRGDAARQQFGFGADSFQLSIDLKEGEKLRSLSLEFAGPKPLGVPYASILIDGQPYIFEFPWPLYYDIERYLPVTPPAAP